jgi:hypothetical protein
MRRQIYSSASFEIKLGSGPWLTKIDTGPIIGIQGGGVLVRKGSSKTWPKEWPEELILPDVQWGYVGGEPYLGEGLSKRPTRKPSSLIYAKDVSETGRIILENPPFRRYKDAPLNKHFDVADVCKIAKCHPKTVLREIARGRLKVDQRVYHPHRRGGSPYLFKKTDIEAWRKIRRTKPGRPKKVA